MGAITRTEVTLIRPTAEPKAGDSYQRERDESDEITVLAWLKQISASRSLSVLGVLTDNAYNLRFRMPEDASRVPGVGWRVRDAEGREYEIKGLTKTGRMVTALLQAVT